MRSLFIEASFVLYLIFNLREITLKWELFLIKLKFQVIIWIWLGFTKSPLQPTPSRVVNNIESICWFLCVRVLIHSSVQSYSRPRRHGTCNMLVEYTSSYNSDCVTMEPNCSMDSQLVVVFAEVSVWQSFWAVAPRGNAGLGSCKPLVS